MSRHASPWRIGVPGARLRGIAAGGRLESPGLPEGGADEGGEMKKTPRLTMLAALALLTIAAAGQEFPAAGVSTTVRVRAVSRDAKILSSTVGGARITIRDEATGVVLAEGLQEGGSGDTESIMVRPRERGAQVYDTPGAAAFETTVQLRGPTVVRVTAEGPLAFPQATRKVSKSLLLIPGQDVLGDGILLEIHGFIVEIETPAESTQPVAGDRLEVRATVRMS
jgi:hypothetical protein